MGIITTLITGDDQDTSVLVTSFSGDTSILFRFSFDASQPQSVNSRIVSCFHELEVEDAKCSFINREEMRQAIYSCIAEVWQRCASYPSILLPDVVVQIHGDLARNIEWQILHESSYQEYLQGLIPTKLVRTSLIPRSQQGRAAFVSLASLRFFNVLGGRGDTTLVRLDNGPHFRRKYVYKGLSYRHFLQFGSCFEDETKIFYHQLSLLYSLPEHPNILFPPSFLVTTKDPCLGSNSSVSDEDYVCGWLYPYPENQSLQEILDDTTESGKVLSPTLKVKWACQIASALQTTHASHQYHMDLKPSNVLLDDDDNTILIDWEQDGASPFFLAPEADGSWDVETTGLERDQDTISHGKSATPMLAYRKYTGPPRENSSQWPQWNSFLVWQIECPYALRAAEVYSLGRTLWAIFEKVSTDDLVAERIHGAPQPISWNSCQDKIPSHWKEFVNRCVDPDPNTRPDLDAVVSFWEKEYRGL